ncbi:ankyrin repeat and protein kinase domain-containing protein 1 isoform X1 [Drosophila eugracilis]|uniref:ankyrin repeat and protein kinase domain-containing protein 1 isoform X1 n=2 Tax=Drosophila eugracilis TaxID=29029 RepID=UPI0007E6D208|nr:ankyrin repeat and protein kinase domain-containing protein 1 isoform X1 [Drosophila eugracilis]
MFTTFLRIRAECLRLIRGLAIAFAQLSCAFWDCGWTNRWRGTVNRTSGWACTTSELPSTNCLNYAIKKGQQFLVKRMLRRRPSLTEYPAPNGFLPLANAIIQGEMCIIDVLLSAGCSVHLGNLGTGRTPLHLAFYYGHLPSAKILLNKKAQLEATDANGMTPAHCAIDADQLEMVKFALEAGANVEARDICGWTLLMRAAVVMNASIKLIKVLVTHGADLAALDDFGKTCSELAKLYRRHEAKDYFDNVEKCRLEKYNKYKTP